MVFKSSRRTRKPQIELVVDTITLQNIPAVQKHTQSILSLRFSKHHFNQRELGFCNFRRPRIPVHIERIRPTKVDCQSDYSVRE